MNISNILPFRRQPDKLGLSIKEDFQEVTLELIRLGLVGIKYVPVKLDGFTHPYIEIKSLKEVMNSSISDTMWFRYRNNTVIIENLDKLSKWKIVVENQKLKYDIEAPAIIN